MTINIEAIQLKADMLNVILINESPEVEIVILLKAMMNAAITCPPEHRDSVMTLITQAQITLQDTWKQIDTGGKK